MTGSMLPVEIRLERRLERPWWLGLAMPFIAVAAALVPFRTA